MFRFRQCLLFVCVFVSATLKTFVLVVYIPYSCLCFFLDDSIWFLPWKHWSSIWFLPWKHWSSCKQVEGTPQGMRDSKRTWWSTCHKINWCLCWVRSNYFFSHHVKCLLGSNSACVKNRYEVIWTLIFPPEIIAILIHVWIPIIPFEWASIPSHQIGNVWKSSNLRD